MRSENGILYRAHECCVAKGLSGSGSAPVQEVEKIGTYFMDAMSVLHLMAQIIIAAVTAIVGMGTLWLGFIRPANKRYTELEVWKHGIDADIRNLKGDSALRETRLDNMDGKLNNIEHAVLKIEFALFPPEVKPEVRAKFLHSPQKKE